MRRHKLNAILRWHYHITLTASWEKISIILVNLAEPQQLLKFGMQTKDGRIKSIDSSAGHTLSLKVLGYCYYISILGCLAEISFSSLMHFSVEKLDVFSLVRIYV